MNGFKADIEKETLENDNFRKVIYTGTKIQLVLMCLEPGEEIGVEIHDGVDQFFRVESGECEAILDGESMQLKDDDVLIVPAGTEHNRINTSDVDDLKMYTIYAPANHPDGTLHTNKAEADEYERQHHN
jgi:mannose-6-phosphate isomerase-like protein (cupin superfamily)